MTIEKSKNGGSFTLKLIGRLDTTTAPQMEQVVNEELDGVTELIIDCGKLDYISSAGLRVLLAAQKAMNAKKGVMVVRNVNEAVKEVFEITGFNEVLTIE